MLYGADCALSRSIHLSHKRLCYAQERYAICIWPQDMLSSHNIHYSLAGELFGRSRQRSQYMRGDGNEHTLKLIFDNERHITLPHPKHNELKYGKMI